MPTTSYATPTMACGVLGARTDDTGTAVADYSAEESRLALSMFTQGYLKPSNAFQVRAQTSPNMSVQVGSGTSKADHYIVSGATAGQGNYLARLDVVTQNVTIAAAGASQARTDEIYLVVRDNQYDSSGRVLPTIGYRQGDPGGANPGPDAAWKASALLARVSVAANATSIGSGAISDQRVAATSLPAPIRADLLVAKGDLIAALSGGSPARFPVGDDGSILVADSNFSRGMRWTKIGAQAFKTLLGQESSTSTVSKDIGLSSGSPDSFVLTMEPYSRYIIEYFIPHFRTGSSRVVFRWGKTAAVTGYYQVTAPPYGGTSNQGVVDYRAFGLDDSQITFGPGGGGDYIAGMFTATAYNPSASNGILGLQFASEQSGVPVYVGAGAWMRYTRTS